MDREVTADQIFERACEVFEDADYARHWIDSQCEALGGIVPRQLMDTVEGRAQLIDELGRIEHGLPS